MHTTSSRLLLLHDSCLGGQGLIEKGVGVRDQGLRDKGVGVGEQGAGVERQGSGCGRAGVDHSHVVKMRSNLMLLAAYVASSSMHDA